MPDDADFGHLGQRLQGCRVDNGVHSQQPQVQVELLQIQTRSDQVLCDSQ